MQRKVRGVFAPPECTSSETLPNESSRNSDLAKKCIFDKIAKKQTKALTTPKREKIKREYDHVNANDDN